MSAAPPNLACADHAERMWHMSEVIKLINSSIVMHRWLTYSIVLEEGIGYGYIRNLPELNGPTSFGATIIEEIAAVQDDAPVWIPVQISQH